MNITLAIAIYGALLSTILAVLQYKNFTRDQSKLRIEAEISPVPSRSALPHDSDDSNYLKVTVTNIGRRTAHIREVVASPIYGWLKIFKSCEQKKLNFHQASDTELNEGEVFRQKLPLTSELKSVLSHCPRLFVSDTRNRFYGLNTRNLRQLKRQIKNAETCSRWQDQAGQEFYVPDRIIATKKSKNPDAW